MHFLGTYVSRPMLVVVTFILLGPLSVGQVTTSAPVREPAAATVAAPQVGTCATAPMKFSARIHNPEFLSVTPASLYEGSKYTIKIVGKNLNPSWESLLLCGSGLEDLTAPIDTVHSTHLLLRATLEAAEGTSGSYGLFVIDSQGNVYDIGENITINSSNDTRYDPCAGPGGAAPSNANLLCSFSPLSYRVELAAFGKGVADHFVAVYVDVQNKNQNLEYLLQDVRGGFPGYVVSSYDKSLPQAVSVKAEQFSARAIIFRLASATASVLTGVAGIADSIALQQAANLFAGPAQAGLQSAIPNLSTAELANLDSQGFSVASTVIPKGGAIRVIAFLPSDILGPSNKDLSTWPEGHPFKNPNSFSTYKGEDLRKLFQAMTIEVAGTHVQDVTPSPFPTLKLFVPPVAQPADFTSDVEFTVEGSGLDSVTSVELISADGKTVLQAGLTALPTSKSKSIDPNLAILTITHNAAAGPGKYEINFVLADGKIVDTNQSITIPAAASPVAP